MQKLNSGPAVWPSGITMLGGISGAVTALPSRDGVCDPGSDIQTSPEGWSTGLASCAAAADADTMTNTTKGAVWAAIRITHLPERNDCAPRSAIPGAGMELQRRPHGISAHARS